MRQLDHPNIIKLIDFSESKQHYYIILELAPGGELFHQIVRLTYFIEDLSRHVITQVAKALHYLHEEKGVVHRYVYLSLLRIYPGAASFEASDVIIGVSMRVTSSRTMTAALHGNASHTHFGLALHHPGLLSRCWVLTLTALLCA